jgi:hypothetical protein
MNGQGPAHLMIKASIKLTIIFQEYIYIGYRNPGESSLIILYPHWNSHPYLMDNR